MTHCKTKPLVVLLVAAASLLASALPAGAIDDDEGGGGDPPPVLGCLTKVTGYIDAEPEVTQGQATTVSWGVSVNNCTGVTVRISGPGLYSRERSGSQTLVPVATSDERAYYERHAFKNGRQWPVGNAAIKVNTVTSTAYGRKTVYINHYWQEPAFVKAIDTPNTTVVLADDLSLDLTGRSRLNIARGVHIIGGRSPAKLGPRLFTTAKTTQGAIPAVRDRRISRR